ncbi:hypothetical protein ACEZCY_07315 [Streptacidiphilus sp. N1-12]|uniref:Protein phosphatase 2C n=2 Tax=Streptacidiphilus alkalitolerans TaxID=3342712 RepID=A0ABV6WAQ2_9ACTN
MSSQGGPSSGQADGAWWDALYQGPDDEVPDTPGADPRQGTVDERFDSASGVVNGSSADAPAAGPSVSTAPGGPPTLVDAPAPGPASTPAPAAAPVPAQAPPPAPAAGVPAPPPLPPLPFRPPRIPPQAPPKIPAKAPQRAQDPRLADPGPGRPPAQDPDSYDNDYYNASSLDDEGYAEPRAVSDARTAAPDREVRDLEDVREANEAEAAAAAADPEPLSEPLPEVVAEPPTAEPPVAEPLPQVGTLPPEYDPEPTALPAADPSLLSGIVPDTALDGARYGTMTLRAASVRGDAARHDGAGRSDRLLTVRFGEGSEALLLVVLATPPSPENPAPADEACRQLAAAVGRSRTELLADLRVGAQERLRYGLQRLTARAAVRLQNVPASGVDAGGGDGGALHALIAPLDPTSRLRAGFGLGPGGLLLLGDDAWYDAYAGRRLVAQQPGGGAAAAPGTSQPLDRFRFRVVVPEPGDVLLLCSDGLAQPLREEPAVSDFLADHWAHPHPPGTVDFLRQVQVRAKGYAADRTAAAIWED